MKINIPRGKFPIIINCRDRLDDLKGLLSWITDVNKLQCHTVIIDNSSSYEPLLQYYTELEKQQNIDVLIMPYNAGKYVLSKCDIKTDSKYFVYTDCDNVPTKDCPSDLIEHLMDLAKKYPARHKIGASVKIDDLPKHFPLKEEVLKNEKANWESKTPSNDSFFAKVDTTFALYTMGKSDVRILDYNLRADKPYTVRNGSWYINPHDFSDANECYAKRATKDSWTFYTIKRSNMLSRRPTLDKSHTVHSDPLPKYPIKEPVKKKTGPKIVQNKQQDIPDTMTDFLGGSFLPGKKYSIRSQSGESTSIDFINDRICKSWGTCIGDYRIKGRRVKIHWRDNSKSVSVLDMDATFKSFVGICTLRGRLGGAILTSAKKTDVREKINYGSKVRQRVSPRRKNHSSQLIVVVPAYKIHKKRIDDFLMWNNQLFKQCNVKVYLVCEKQHDFPYDYVNVVTYKEDQKVFSIPKTVNYGIRRIKENGIIIKTDIDIIFSRAVLDHIKRQVVIGIGCVCICADVENPKDALSHSAKWKRIKKIIDGRGACFALTKHDWYKMRGYNEDIEGWGGDDTELWQRCNKVIEMYTSFAYPLFHIKHKARKSHAPGTFFEVKSDRNMKIAASTFWNNDDWGQPDADCIDYHMNSLADLSDQKSKVKLGVVIPYRKRYDNAAVYFQNIEKSADVEYLLVNLGDRDSKIEDLCKKHGIKYKFENYSGVFQIGRCMNIAASELNCDYLFTNDVDCIPVPGFFTKMLSYCEYLDRQHNEFAFGIYGVYFASDKFSKTYLTKKLDSAVVAMIKSKAETRETKQFCGSMPLVKRKTFLKIGGIHNDFRGHGAEDFFLIHQLNSEWQQYKPGSDYPGQGTEAAGMRKMIAYYRDRTFKEGMFLIHRHHPRNDKDAYNKDKKKNWDLMYELIRRWDRRITVMERHGFFPSNQFKKLFGPHIITMQGKTTKELEDIIQNNDVKAFVHSNPLVHGIDKLRDVAVKNGIKSYCVERGALTNTMFIDPNGFNYLSKSYSPKYWDKPLTEDQKKLVVAYIDKYKKDASALERQPNTCPVPELRKKYKIGDRKVLFVPLQVPNDTVIRKWAGWVDSVQGLVNLCDKLAKRMPGWRILIKKHPTDNARYRTQNCMLVDAHFKDLMTLSDCVMVINSGVGLQALMWQKPVLITGKCFYHHPSLTMSVDSINTIAKNLNNPLHPDIEKVYRLIYYLVYEFYSDVRFTRSESDFKLGKTTSVTWDKFRTVCPYEFLG